MKTTQFSQTAKTRSAKKGRYTVGTYAPPTKRLETNNFFNDLPVSYREVSIQDSDGNVWVDYCGVDNLISKAMRIRKIEGEELKIIKG